MNPTKRTLLLLGLLVPSIAFADEIERAPIHYDTAPTDNRISRFEKNALAPSSKDPRSFLKAMLAELKIPESSQVLVFSRTSLQRRKIAPETPRAIYFNDDLYFGTCQDSNLFEISAVDKKLGVVFYSTEFQSDKPTKFVRHNDACMSCHGSSATAGYPGHMVRSVFPDAEGYPLLSLGSYRVDHRTPFKQRWGGWYVTGFGGKQTHLGNRLFTGEADRDQVDPKAHNRADLRGLVDVSSYLQPHSDLVALMVLEHQAEMQNLFTRANFQTRIGEHQDQQLNVELGRSKNDMSDTTWRRIQSVGEQTLKYLLFSEEASLTEPISGTSSFAKDFAKLGPRDGKGRSLRDLDLKTRLFRHPCSYLIYSEQFQALPSAMKDYILRRLHAILTGRDSRPAFGHLSPGDRRAILEILRETLPNLPDYWRS